MFQIEKLSDNCFYVKAIGTFPQPVAEDFVKKFDDATKDVKENLNVIVDITDAIFLKFESFDIILDLFKRDNKRLNRSAFVISDNPPLDVEFAHLIKKAESDKRKIVSTLEEAKKWVGIENLVVDTK
jgi:hypothetical protein